MEYIIGALLGEERNHTLNLKSMETEQLVKDLQEMGYTTVVGYDNVHEAIELASKRKSDKESVITEKARVELRLLESDDLAKPYEEYILKFIDEFAKRSGDSGMSINFTAHRIAQVIEKLLLQQSLEPLTFSDSEWTEVYRDSDGTPVFQNKREAGVFKDGINGDPYFIGGLIFRSIDNDWDQFTGQVEGFNSKCYFKNNHTPKKFFIDVNVVECEPTEDNRWYEASDAYPYIHKYVISNHKQLDEASKYYRLSTDKDENIKQNSNNI